MSLVLYVAAVLVAVQLVPTLGIAFGPKNVCRYWTGYNFAMAGNPNCWYNTDMILTTPELIDKYTGGKHESYEMTTDDGFILTMYRFPPPRRNPPKGVVVMRHPPVFDGRIWVTQGNTSTAVLVWRDGWDVWLPNTRGTEHSERHVNLTQTQSKFWDWSFDDVAEYDVRSEIDLIRSRTGNNAKIYYIAHSLGAATALAYASAYPQEAQDAIEVFISACTPCYFASVTSPASLLYLIQPIIEFIFSDTLDLGPLIPIIPTVAAVARLLYRFFPPLTYLINIVYSIFLGWSIDETDPQFINFDVYNNVKNISWKTLYHIMQLLKARDRFQKYDYGPAENLRRYGTARPPEYPVWNISVPVYLISSSRDSIASVKDSDLLYSRLSPQAKKYGYLHINRLNHMDIHSGLHRIELFVNNVIKLLNNIQNRR